MNAIVTPATIRGRAALMEFRALLDQLVHVDNDISLAESFEEPADGIDILGGISITKDELLDVLARRRADIVNRLENKGICIRPDPIALPVEAAA